MASDACVGENERRKNFALHFSSKFLLRSPPSPYYTISRRLLVKMAASLSSRCGGSVGSTAAMSAGRGAAARAPIAAAARPSSSTSSAAVVAAAASLRRSSNGACPVWPRLHLARLSSVFLWRQTSCREPARWKAWRLKPPFVLQSGRRI